MSPASLFWPFLVLALFSGCAAVGPHPSIVAVGTEIKATKNVEKILVAPTTGTGTAELSQSLNRVVPANAYKRYKDSMILAAGLSGPLATLKMPVVVTPLLTANWQTAFITWLAADKANAKTKTDDGAAEADDQKIARPKSQMRISLPKTSGRPPKSVPEEKHLAATLEKHADTYAAMAKPVMGGNTDELVASVSANAGDLKLVERLLRDLEQRLQISYVLVSHLDGDREAFDRNQPITLHVALINMKSGKFRIYARSIGHKKDLSADFDTLVGIMAQNLFEDVEQVDQVEI